MPRIRKFLLMSKATFLVFVDVLVVMSLIVTILYSMPIQEKLLMMVMSSGLGFWATITLRIDVIPAIKN